jgi:hypothetical protein
MGLLLIVSIGAMTSFMTMVQLIALTLTTMQTPAVQTKVAPRMTESVSAKSHTKKNAKVSRTSTHHTRRNGPHSAHALNASHETR